MCRRVQRHAVPLAVFILVLAINTPWVTGKLYFSTDFSAFPDANLTGDAVLTGSRKNPFLELARRKADSYGAAMFKYLPLSFPTISFRLFFAGGADDGRTTDSVLVFRYAPGTYTAITSELTAPNVSTGLLIEFRPDTLSIYAGGAQPVQIANSMSLFKGWQPITIHTEAEAEGNGSILAVSWGGVAGPNISITTMNTDYDWRFTWAGLSDADGENIRVDNFQIALQADSLLVNITLIGRIDIPITMYTSRIVNAVSFCARGPPFAVRGGAPGYRFGTPRGRRLMDSLDPRIGTIIYPLYFLTTNTTDSVDLGVSFVQSASAGEFGTVVTNNFANATFNGTAIPPPSVYKIKHPPMALDALRFGNPAPYIIKNVPQPTPPTRPPRAPTARTSPSNRTPLPAPTAPPTRTPAAATTLPPTRTPAAVRTSPPTRTAAPARTLPVTRTPLFGAAATKAHVRTAAALITAPQRVSTRLPTAFSTQTKEDTRTSTAIRTTAATGNTVPSGSKSPSPKLTGTLAAPVVPPTPTGLPCPSRVDARATIGTQSTCVCSTSALTSGGNIWGSNPYTDDSSLCKAAKHSGQIVPYSVPGYWIVTYTITASLPHYIGSTQNGIKSSSSGTWGGSVTIGTVVMSVPSASPIVTTMLTRSGTSTLLVLPSPTASVPKPPTAATTTPTPATAPTPSGARLPSGSPTPSGLATASALSTHSGTISAGFDSSGCFIELFKSSSSYVEVSPLVFGGDVTVELWFKLTRPSLQKWARLFDFGNGKASDNFVAAIVNNTVLIATYNPANPSPTEPVTGQLTSGTWMHLAISTTAAGKMSSYINGTAFRTDVPLGAVSTLQRTTNFIGRSNWASDPYIDLGVLEFRLWNVVRTPQQIAAQYQTKIMTCEPGLVLRLGFDSWSGNLDTCGSVTAQLRNGTTYSNCGTPTVSATAGPSPTVTNTPTPSGTPTVSATEGPTPTVTNTPTPSDTPTVSATGGPSPTVTNTPTPSGTPTVTATEGPSPTVTTTPTPSGVPCTGTSGQRGNNGVQYSCVCTTAQLTSGTVWGSNPYTDDSSICTAAKHSGSLTAWLAPDYWLVTYTIAPGESSYTASTQNNISTVSFGSFSGSIVFNATASLSPTPSPSVTETSTPTGTPSPTGSPTASPSPSVTATSTPTGSPSPTDTPTASSSAVPSPTPSLSPSPSVTVTSTPTGTPSPTV